MHSSLFIFRFPLFADAVASVGPIPLTGYAPGAYVVRLDATDAVSKQTLRHEAPLEIRQ